MKEIQKIILKYDSNKNIYLINDNKVEQDVWVKTKSVWENEQSYNHIKKFVDKYGFTDCDCYTKDNINVWIFTTVKR